jgi:hypothetical protein
VLGLGMDSPTGTRPFIAFHSRRGRLVDLGLQSFR